MCALSKRLTPYIYTKFGTLFVGEAQNNKFGYKQHFYKQHKAKNRENFRNIYKQNAKAQFSVLNFKQQ